MLITQQIDELKQPFLAGKIFAYTTEAVYGLGCDPGNETAVSRLLELKQRPINKGLILVASDFSQVQKYLKPLSNEQLAFTKPSATTYIFPALSSAPHWLTGDFDSLAIRISQHPIVHKLCEALGSALVSTSANISGQTPAKSAHEVNAQLGEKVRYILEGELGNADKPSLIRDSISGKIFRQ
jgi:L-threonylcarbamoyladenylate synthase